ncbi:MAG: FimV family protein [Betaproteobacteria bacterium]|nr:FimV family protein [Betaproteobacteria bacterium]
MIGRARNAVRDLIVKTWLVALLFALAPCVANAAGLGRLTVLSALGQPLNAEVELVSVSKEELSSLSARLALPDAYRQANLQYNAALPGARLSIEKRADGQPYLKITSSRPVNEPFIDLLIELTWSSGRLVREYTALLDPPGLAPEPPAPAVSVAPEPRPVPETLPAPEPQPPVTAAVSTPIVRAPRVGEKEYGPIQRGETLGKIAKSVMPQGVTLEQMLVALYRGNPEAFIRKNLNLVRTGKILRIPESEAVTAIAKGEAVKEYRMHVADWNAYRQKLADAAGMAPSEARSAARGKITAKVEDKGAGGPKDVVRLSKGEPPGAPGAKGKPRSAAERIRMLEEEVVARERALNEANERVTQLEKTIKDMQKLVELKSPAMAAAQQQAQLAAKPEAPKPKPMVVAPPPPQPDLIDQAIEVVSDPLYLAAGGGVIALGGLAFWMVRRRRAQEAADDTPPRSAPILATAAVAAAGAAAATLDAAAATPTATPARAGAVAASTEEVDPLAEAEVYIAYGRDGQAEEILKEALAKAPMREDVQLKLLEIYAARKDKTLFGRLAGGLHKQTSGAGENWLKVAAMGYALEPGNALYEAGKGTQAPVPAPRGPITGSDLDFDLGLSGPAGLTTTDITLDADAAQAATQTVLDTGMAAAAQRAEEAPTAGPLVPDFTLDVPPAGAATRTDLSLDAAAPAPDTGVIDFHIDLPKTQAAGEGPRTVVTPAAPPGGLDFKLDIPEVNLNLAGGPKTVTAAAGDKNGHWYDVQTKFDLAKAYQEMGDKAGAKEILQEVIKEGDAEQKAQAKALLNTLG